MFVLGMILGLFLTLAIEFFAIWILIIKDK